VLIDGEVVTLPYTYLADCCQCPKCKDPKTSQKTFNTGDIPLDIQPAAMRGLPNMLEVIWQGGRHRSTFSVDFLAQHKDRQALTASRHNDRRPILWDAQTMQGQVPAVSVTFGKFKQDEGTLAHVVQALQQYGLAFITGCPAGHAKSEEAQHELAKLATRIGPLKRTFYGETWNVQSLEDAKNVAYTSVDLDLHMDLLYFESPPGLQFLYCLENEVQGGTSVFVDSFNAAEEMRLNAPEHFKTLCTYDVDYEYRNDGQWYHYSRPTFIISKETGKVEFVNYSPPFQGTQNPQGFEAYQEAIALYAKLLAKPQNRLELLLEEGTCVVFNNRRTLHARKSFGPGRRWLKGAYVDIDALWSKDRQYKS
ncbi:taurine catabolism dioxygenase TauD, TfdA family-domain-containing protein, partial [Protomyces lactucae-debilis]